MNDKNGKEIVLQDYVANKIVGVEIGTLGHKLWVCIDGVAVLRVKSPQIDLQDLRERIKCKCEKCGSDVIEKDEADYVKLKCTVCSWYEFIWKD